MLSLEIQLKCPLPLLSTDMSPEPREVDAITGFTQLIFQQALSQDDATGLAHGHVPQQSLWPPVVTVLRAPLSP